jgi:transcriptional regulator with XRE-family HTH domain
MHFTPNGVSREKEESLGTIDDNVSELLGDMGSRIAQLRRAKGWNQGELARRMGLKSAQISKFERGAYMPKTDILPRLSEVLGVSSDYLLTGRSFGEPQRDYRLRERLEALEALPEPQRNHLVDFLDALISAHKILRRYQESGEQKQGQGTEGRKGGRPARRPPQDQG